MDENSQDQAPPTPGELARAAAACEEQADVHAIAMRLAEERGKTVIGYHRLDDGGLSITFGDGATTAVDAATAVAWRAEWMTAGRRADALTLVRKQEADRRRVQLERKLGRDTAHVTEFYRDDAGVKRTRLKTITLAPRRPAASRGIGRAARQATNHRSAGSRRTAASSSTAGTDPGDPDPEPPAAPLRLAPSPRAVLTFGVLTAERRGAAIV